MGSNPFGRAITCCFILKNQFSPRTQNVSQLPLHPWRTWRTWRNINSWHSIYLGDKRNSVLININFRKTMCL